MAEAAESPSGGCKRGAESGEDTARNVRCRTERGIAVVTGGSRGIGAATCKLLAADGYTVAVVFRDQAEAAQAVVEEINSAGGTASKFRANMSDEIQVVELFESVVKHWPNTPLTALVNNAGVIGPQGEAARLANVTGAQLQEVFSTNVLGPLIACREFSRCAGRKSSDAASGAGRAAIVNVSSGSAYIGKPPLYAMSKAALNTMQTALVAELAAEGIRINTISPGMTQTDMIAEAAPGFDMKLIPLGRFGEPLDMAQAILFLLSEQRASYISGANIRVAGGRPPGTHLG
eukprot:TRINITY_DN9205_c0_g2_i1.p1 TRINITY_DN9205_c0_g2~~TRINITY_DN9205_c0_g2_i1.p1  ORF type:complete len:319 (+),score=43.97 TRINITY_DN9205_c0_g2_i1:88-957(+)